MKKWLLFFVGIIILTFGARLLLLSEMGVGGLDAVAVGIARRYDMRIGTVLVGLSVTLIIIGDLLNHKVVLLPILTAMIIGKCYDLWGSLLFNRLVLPEARSWHGLIYLLGLIIAPAGAALYISSDISLGPIDYLMRSAEKRYTISMQNSRIALESLFVIAGLLIGGPVGMGTIGIMLFWGPILQLYYAQILKWLEQYKNKKLHFIGKRG